MSKHTPGPWDIQVIGTQVDILGMHPNGTVQSLARIHIKSCNCCPGEKRSFPVIANAIIIASAPDMLEALRRVVFTTKQTSLLPEEVIQQCREVIDYIDSEALNYLDITMKE